MYIPPNIAAYLFAAGNLLASTHCWYTSGRRLMLGTAVINSAVVASGGLIYDADPFLGNLHIGGGALSAAAMYIGHGIRCPKLWRPVWQNGLYYTAIVAVLFYSRDALKWAWALRYD